MGFAQLNQQLVDNEAEFNRFRRAALKRFVPFRSFRFDRGRRGTYDAPAMDDALRARQSFTALAKSGQVIEVDREVGDFERLSSAVDSDHAALDAADRPRDWRTARVTGEIAFGLSPGPDEVAVLQGHLAATVALACQRCMQPFDWPLQTSLRLQLCREGDIAGALEGYELWEVDGEAVSPLEIADEAMVMALPLSARHENTAGCSIDTPAMQSENKRTPFASLRAQIGKTRDNS